MPLGNSDIGEQFFFSINTYIKSIYFEFFNRELEMFFLTPLIFVFIYYNSDIVSTRKWPLIIKYLKSVTVNLPIEQTR